MRRPHRRDGKREGEAGGKLTERPCLNSVEAWPHQLRDLVLTFGAKEVWNLGLATLGYPPLWCHTGYEFRTVRDALANKYGSKCNASTFG